MKTSKTSFEVVYQIFPILVQISLAKMLDTTTKQIEEDIEPDVVNCGMDIDEKWPEPESPKKRSRKRFRVSIHFFVGLQSCLFCALFALSGLPCIFD